MFPTNTVQPETQETGEGGAVSASPLPVSPSPRGRFPIDTLPGSASTTVSRLIRVKILFPPRARYPDYRHTLPAPLRGREEAAERPGGGGVSHEYRSTRDAGDMGGGSRLRLSPLRQPLPRGAILPGYRVRWAHHLTRFPVINAPEDPLSPRARPSGQSPLTALPPIERVVSRKRRSARR